MKTLILTLSLALSISGFAQSTDSPKVPKLGPPPALKLPPIHHFSLSNGLKVSVMEKHEVPLVQMELIVRSGSINDPPGMSGVASMTAAMLEEGAGTRNSLELSDAIDFLGADISAFASQHTSGVVMHTPLSKLDSALTLFADVALRPTFPPEELERNRKERLTTLMQWHDEARAIASVIYSRTLFGTSHPYGIPSMGNEKSLRAMTVDDLRKFHREAFQPNNGFIVVSGDISADNVKSRLEQLFGSWKTGSVTPVSLPTAEQVSKRRVIIVDKPGAPQSEIRIGRIGVQRLTEDFFRIVVMNTILGGSFTSRLNHNLREVHGYTYGASSGFDFRPTPGPFTAAAAVQTNVTDKALSEFMKELTGILQPVSDDELSRAKNYLALRYPENFQTVSQLAGQLSDLQVYGLPDDFFNSYIQKILGVTKEDVRTVAKRYLDPEKVDIIIVGDRKVIEPGIAALNLGPIESMTIDEVLGAAPVIDPGK